jgi:hypothetical protein
MQYTLRNIPAAVDARLRQRARQQRKSLNEVAIEALADATGESLEPVVRRDLSDIAGTWVADPAMDEIFEDLRRVDPEEWK